MIDLLGSNKIAKAFEAIETAFEAMETAERVLAENGLTDDPNMFKLLQPTEAMLALVPRVYESHAEELCRRYLAGGDTRLATKAEVLLSLMHTSFMSPLNHDGCMLYERLFVDVMGALPFELDGVKYKEEWPGQFEEALAEARVKLRCDERKPKRET